ncbi:MAG: GerMN domain-containing protein [Terriglobia bacterium]
MTVRAKILLLILLMALGAGGFYLRSLAQHVFLEPTPRAEEAARAKLNQFALQPNNGTMQLATLYFPALNEGKILPESRSITWAQADADRVRQVVLALAEGSHQGYGRVLPASTTVRAVFLAPDGTAYVDLSNDILSDLEPGIQSETLTIYSIVNSVAINIPSVKRVQFLIQGQEVETLDGHADLTAAFVPDSTRVKSGP